MGQTIIWPTEKIPVIHSITSQHQVSTTNVSKKSFNICPIETYTRYVMELLFYLMDDIFQVLQSIINTFVVYNVAFDSL